MVKKSRAHRTEPAGGLVGAIMRSLLRGTQFIVSLLVVGLYGQQLSADASAHRHADPRWVYAAVVAGLSALTAIVYLLPFVKGFRMWAWDTVLGILWAALFGVFAQLYMRTSCEDGKGKDMCQKMKTAVWFDLVGMLVWLLSAAVGAWVFWRDRNRRVIYTGRTRVV